jgi:hypothetical protein
MWLGNQLTRRVILGVAALLLFVSLAAPAFAQTSGSPTITLTHEYKINAFGFGILNDSVTFQNNGTTTEQIPTIQLGIPNNVSSHAAGFVVEPSSQYSMTSNDVNGVTIFTIVPTSSSLAAGSFSTVSLKTYLTGILNFSAASTTGIKALLLLSPSLNQEVSSIQRTLVLPPSGTITPGPTGFNASATSVLPTYTSPSTDVTPAISTESVVFNATDEASFQPVQVYSVISSVVPSANGLPQVEDQVTLRNLATYPLSSLPLALLANVTQITVLPSSSTPLINPTPVTLTNGALSLTEAPFVAAINAGDNFTFTFTYPLPTSLISTSGTDVVVNVPYTLPIDAVVQSYTVDMSLPSGFVAVGQSAVQVANASSLTQSKVALTYRIVPGWGAEQMVPAASAVFAAAFILLVMKRPETASKERSEEEEKDTNTKLSDLTKAFEDKIALIEKVMDDMKDKEPGSVSRADFIKTRNELDSLKSRAMNRLSEAKQASGSQKFTDLLSQIQEVGREEDRATKDLLNLYEQYQSKRMREDTFERLLPNYKKRLGAVTNHLSDLLNMIQKEGTDA